MRNVRKILTVLTIVLTVAALSTCSLGGGLTETPDDGHGEHLPGTSIGGQSAIGDRLYVSNMPVYHYDDDTGEITPFEYDGTIELISASEGEKKDLFPTWEDPDPLGPLDMTASVTNNKLSFDIGIIPPEMIVPLSARLEFSVSPINVKGRIVHGFYYEEYEEENEDDEISWYYFQMTNKHNVNEVIAFVYVDTDAEITGIDEWYNDLSLKKGWNSVKFDRDRFTVETFVPDDNYVWLDSGGDDPGAVGFGPLHIHERVTKINGTINVTVDGTFPTGGITLEAYMDWQGQDGLGLCDVTSGNNPASWEFTGFPPNFYGNVYFTLKVYPDADRNTFFITRPYPQSEGTYIKMENEDDPEPEHEPWYEPEFELVDVVLQNYPIETMTVPLSISGTGGAITVYAYDYYYGPSAGNYGMTIESNGTHNFKLPTDLGDWLWFRVVTSSGKSYVTKGRVNAGSTVNLTIGQMYAE